MVGLDFTCQGSGCLELGKGLSGAGLARYSVWLADFSLFCFGCRVDYLCPPLQLLWFWSVCVMRRSLSACAFLLLFSFAFRVPVALWWFLLLLYQFLHPSSCVFCPTCSGKFQELRQNQTAKHLFNRLQSGLLPISDDDLVVSILAYLLFG